MRESILERMDGNATPCPRRLRLRRDDGVELVVEQHGEAGAPALLFAHGFGQTRHAWRGAAETFAARGYHVISFDARGHGDSSHAGAGGYAIDAFLGDLAAVAALAPRPPVLVGASMSGLFGLGLAGEREPAPFSALALVDITPRWEPAGVTRVLDFMRANPGGFASAAEAATAVAAYLPQRRDPRAAERFGGLLREGPDGRLHWHWDPQLLQTVGADATRHQPRLIDAARRVRVPVLLLSGGRSDVVSDATVAEFLDLVPHARHVRVPRATHMLVGDANDAFTREIARFLQSPDP